MINDVTMNFALMNCQSLKMKLKPLAENFNTNKASFIITNETWFKCRDLQLKTLLANMEDKHDIKAIRKDRKTGKKGLATKCDLKKFQLNALRGRTVREYE